MYLNFSINNVFTWRVECVIPISRAIFGSGVKFDSWHASHEICIACFLLIYSLIIGHVELEMIWTGQLVRNVQPIAGPSADYLCVRRIGCSDVGADQSQRSVADRWPSDAAQLVFAFVNLKKKFFFKKKRKKKRSGLSVSLSMLMAGWLLPLTTGYFLWWTLPRTKIGTPRGRRKSICFCFCLARAPKYLRSFGKKNKNKRAPFR